MYIIDIAICYRRDDSNIALDALQIEYTLCNYSRNLVKLFCDLNIEIIKISSADSDVKGGPPQSCCQLNAFETELVHM